MSESFQVSRVGIVGGGLMGSGIAEVAAVAELPTVLVKATPGPVAELRARVERALARRVDKGKLAAAVAEAALARLTVTDDRTALAGCDLVVESIVEDLALKRSLFAELATTLPVTTILASNTSTLRIRDLAGPASADRTVGLHFFSPVPAMSLVELAHLPTTRPAILAAAAAFVARLGKTAVPVLDSTGFVVNRLLVPYLLGAISAYAQGLAPAPAIDTAMKLGCGHPMGPLALCDLIGLDIVYAMAKLLYKDFGDARFQPPALLRRLVQDGQLGAKTGVGFYDYRHKPAQPNQAVWRLIGGEARADAA